MYIHIYIYMPGKSTNPLRVSLKNARAKQAWPLSLSLSLSISIYLSLYIYMYVYMYIHTCIYITMVAKCRLGLGLGRLCPSTLKDRAILSLIKPKNCAIWSLMRVMNAGWGWGGGGCAGGGCACGRRGHRLHRDPPHQREPTLS